MVDEFTKVAGRLDLASMLGLEIGPLYRPRIPRDRANVRYLDHLSTNGLRAKYQNDPNVSDHLEQIVAVDYVAEPGQLLSTVVGADVPFDYVVASHVIEHMPNLVGWFEEVAELLAPSGYLCLVVPDLRYTFDARRQPTTPAQVVDAYLRQVTLPSFQQAFDFHYEGTPDIPVPELWAGKRDLTSLRRHGARAAAIALDRCEHVRATGDYEDIHCSTFTPHSFLLILEALVQVDLFAFQIVDFYPTEFNRLEFFVTLQKTMPSTDRCQEQLESFRTAATKISEHEAKVGPALDVPRAVELSPLEHKLVELKRSVLHKARRLLSGRR